MKKHCLSFLAVLFIFSTSACDAADAPRPRLELHAQKFNGGNPEIWIDIYPNGQPLQDIRIDWGRHSVDTQPTLYATSGLNQLESVEFIDIASDNILNVSLLQISSPFRLYAKFGFTDLMEEDEVLHYKVRTTHHVDDEQGGENILYTWSDQFSITYESPGAGGVNGGGVVLGETCLDPIPTPTIIEPQANAICFGDVGPATPNPVTVSLRWESVEGIAKHSQAYQVEIRTSEDEEGCEGDWDEGSPNFYNSDLPCSISDTNVPEWSENLPTNTTFFWRVRASCVLEDGDVLPGDFTPTREFTTADSAQCGNQ